jgi:hypothetical protein
LACEDNKNGEVLPAKRHNRGSRQEEGEQKGGQWKGKRKSLGKEKYSYRLSAHEKELSELEEYRAFFPHETVTGPQFQAHPPPSRLFSSNSPTIQTAPPGSSSDATSCSNASRGYPAHDIIIL